MGKAKAQQKLIDNLEDVFGKVELTLKDLFNMAFLILRFLIPMSVCVLNFVFDMETGTKRASLTKRRFPKRGAVQGGAKWLQHRQV